MMNIQNMFNEYGLNMNNPAVQNLARSVDPGSTLPGSFYSNYQQAPNPYMNQNNINTQYYNGMGLGNNYQNPYAMNNPYGVGFNPYQQQNANNYYMNQNLSYNNYQPQNIQHYNGSTLGAPMVYNHKAYNEQLLQQYYANGCRPMYIKYGDEYQEYNPGFEYHYKPSTEEKRAAYKYFSDNATPYEMGQYLSNDPSVIPEPERKYKEWLAQFEQPVKSPEDEIKDFLERRNGPHDESDEHFHNVARKLYQEGKISFAEYSAVANGGIEYTTDNGVTVNQQYDYQSQSNGYTTPFGWGGYGYMNQQYIEQQRQQQQAYDQHLAAMQMAYNVARRFNGITDEDIKNQQEQQMQDFIDQQNYYGKLYDIASYEYKIDSFAQHAQSGTYSYEKGYMSPAKEKFINHYNKVYDDRHKHVVENMTFKDFMIGGGYADIYFADMKYQNRQEVQKLANLYDDIMCRDCINEVSPFYDPRTGRAPRGLKINRNEIEISVPPELMAQSYEERKNKFFNQISQGHKHPLQDTEYFAGQYLYNANVVPNNMITQPPNPYMRI